MLQRLHSLFKRICKIKIQTKSTIQVAQKIELLHTSYQHCTENSIIFPIYNNNLLNKTSRKLQKKK